MSTSCSRTCPSAASCARPPRWCASGMCRKIASAWAGATQRQGGAGACSSRRERVAPCFGRVEYPGTLVATNARRAEEEPDIFPNGGRSTYMDEPQLFYSIAAMNALFSSLAWCAAKPNRASILSVILFAVIWPFTNGPLEGHTFMVLAPSDGITVSDMLSVVAIIVAAVQGVRQTGGRTSRARSDRRRLPPGEENQHGTLEGNAPAAELWHGPSGSEQ